MTDNFFDIKDIFGILIIVGSWLKLTRIALNDRDKDLRKKEKKDD